MCLKNARMVMSLTGIFDGVTYISHLWYNVTKAHMFFCALSCGWNHCIKMPGSLRFHFKPVKSRYVNTRDFTQQQGHRERYLSHR